MTKKDKLEFHVSCFKSYFDKYEAKFYDIGKLCQARRKFVKYHINKPDYPVYYNNMVINQRKVDYTRQ